MTEAHAKRSQFVESQNQVAQISSKTVEPPNHEQIELPPPGILQEDIQRRAGLPRPADASIHKLGGSEAPRLQ